MGKTYQLSGSIKVEVQEDTFIFHYPLQSRKVPSQDIYGYYIYPFLKGQFLLVIGYTVGQKRKRLNIPLDASLKEEFMVKLQALSPASANLLDKSKKEALRSMGARDQVTFSILIILGVIMPAILIGMYFPVLWHGIFDSRLATTSIEDIYSGNLPDSNYISFAVILENNGIITTETQYRPGSNGMLFRSKNKMGYYPLYPQGWQQGQPVKVVLLVRERDMATAAEQIGQTTNITGLIRNILWEGLSSSNAIRLGNHINSPVDAPILVEYRSDPKTDLQEAFFIMYILVGVMVVILIRMFFRGRIQKK